MLDEYIGRRLADKYEVEELLREDSFGNVYRGRHLLMDKPVVLKILSRSLAIDDLIVERFSEEARRISRLSHPNILNVTDFGRDYDGSVFVVTEEARGETVKDILQREGSLSVERSVRIARQVAAGLSAMHAGGMTHLNLSSDSVLIMPMANGSELVKIVDMGSFSEPAILDFEDDASLEPLYYLSPERCTGESDGDERSDVYSLGILFYEMLIGEVPFVADTPTELMLKHVEVPPPPFAAFRDDVPEEIEPVAEKALEKQPDARYQTASAFAEDLTSAARVDRDDALLAAKPRKKAKSKRFKNVVMAGMLVLITAGLVGAGVIYTNRTPEIVPQTVVQIDENGMPVQPLNPATGIAEKNLQRDMNLYSSGSMSPEDLMTRPEFRATGGGGDGYDPWRNPGSPPGGSSSVGPPIGEVNIPPSSSSIFMQDQPVGYDDSGNPIYLVPVQKGTPTPEATKPKENKADSSEKPKKETNTAAPKPDSKKPVEAKPSPPKPAKTNPKKNTSSAPKKNNDVPNADKKAVK